MCGPCSISSRDCVYADGAKPDELAAQDKGSPMPITGRSPMNSTLATIREVSVPRSVTEAIAAPPRPPPPPRSTSTTTGPSPRALYPSPVEHGPVPLAEAYQYVYSPDTVASELLTTDMASNRWLDLLATDAAQADAGFSLAPSPAPEDSVSNTGAEEARAIGTENMPPPGANAMASTPDAPAFERNKWSLDRDIILTNDEALLFRSFAERASLWVSPPSVCYRDSPLWLWRAPIMTRDVSYSSIYSTHSSTSRHTQSDSR